MLFVVRFVDKPDMLSIRQKYLAAHIEWLENNKVVILVGGSLRTDPQNVPVGALWIAQAESKAVVEKLILDDPFWINGLRESVEILHWSKANPEVKVCV